jgi:hypothetical protein
MAENSRVGRWGLVGWAACDTVGVGVPSGTVTSLFTDVEETMRLWESAPSAMGTAMARHCAARPGLHPASEPAQNDGSQRDVVP